MRTTDKNDALPIQVADEERLARALFHPYHFNKAGKIKPSAFKAPSGRNDVSVNRLCALNADACKKRSKAIRNPGDFKGFAVLSALSVRQSGSDVIDSRQIYLGHADIIHDVFLNKGVPAPPEFNQRLKKMADSSVYFPDPNPVSDDWTGADFTKNTRGEN